MHVTEGPQRKLSVVIPVFNEKGTIESLIAKVRSSQLPAGWEKEIIIVDDGSTDGSRELLKQFETTCSVILRRRNGGKGAALKDGFRAARGDYLLIQDADLEYDPDNYSILLEGLLPTASSVVFGSRTLEDQNIPFSQVYFYGGLLLTKLFNSLFGSNITDLATCYKLFPRSYVKDLCLLPSNDFVFDVVELSYLLLTKAAIREVPVRYVSRTKHEGKKLNWTHGFRCLRRMLSLWLESRKRHTDPLPGDASMNNDPSRFEFEALKEATRYRAALLEEFAPYLRGKVLEVGSGIGDMTEGLRKCRAVQHLLCVEPDPDFCQIIRQRLPDQTVLKGTVEDVQDTDWDVICSTNVLEHIADDESELELYARLLRPRRGVLVLFVPARPELYSPIDALFGHYRRYTRQELLAKLSQAGFRVEMARYFNILGYFGWWFTFCLLRQRRFNPKAVRFFDRWLFPLGQEVESVMRPPPFGQSLIVVARSSEMDQ